VPQQAEPRHIGAGVDLGHLRHQLGGLPVERDHGPDGPVCEGRVGLFPFQGGADDPRAEGFRQDEPVADAAAAVAKDPAGVDDPRDGETVFRLVVLHAVTAHEGDIRLVHLVQPALQDAVQHLHGELLRGKTDDVHCRDGPAAHGVDVRQGVGGRDLPEEIGVVHDGREEVQRQDDRQIVPQAVDPCVLEPLDPRDQVRVGSHGQPFQRSVQVLRTDLAGSAGPVDHLGEPDFLFLRHGALLSIFRSTACRAHLSRWSANTRGRVSITCQIRVAGVAPA